MSQAAGFYEQQTLLLSGEGRSAQSLCEQHEIWDPEAAHGFPGGTVNFLIVRHYWWQLTVT